MVCCGSAAGVSFVEGAPNPGRALCLEGTHQWSGHISGAGLSMQLHMLHSAEAPADLQLLCLPWLCPAVLEARTRIASVTASFETLNCVGEDKMSEDNL